IFGSITYATSSASSSRLRTSSAHFTIASSVVTFSSEPIAVKCRTFWNFSDGGAPTRCVERDELVVVAVVRRGVHRGVVEHVVLVQPAAEERAELGRAGFLLRRGRGAHRPG